MIRPDSFYFSLIVISLIGIYGCTGTRGLTSTPGQKISAQAETGDVAEARNLSKRAEDLTKKGEYDEALPLAQRALEIREKALGPEHPETAAALHQLAQIYAEKPLMTISYKAMSHYQRALKIREKVLGPEHPDTAATLAGLAGRYARAGMFSKALSLAQRSLQVREKALGEEHPDTAASLNFLGWLYFDMGSSSQALSLTQRSLKIREKVLGPDHLGTSYSLENLAKIHRQMGDLSEALRLAQRCLMIREKTLGPEHPHTSRAFIELGLVYLRLGDYGMAEANFSQAKKESWKDSWAELYLATGRYEEALAAAGTFWIANLSPPQSIAHSYTQRGLALKGLGLRLEAYTFFLDAIQAIEDLRSRTP